MLGRTGLALLLVVLVVLVPAAAGEATAKRATAPTAWLSYGHDGQLRNFVRMSGFSPNSARRLRAAWQRKLDSAIWAGLLYARRTLFVETGAGSVYALRSGNGSIKWRRTFGTVSTASCGDYGFNSTGAIDLKLGVLYVIGAKGFLHALSLANGRERKGWPLPITAAHSDGEYVWGGLRMVGRTLYVPVASYCDVPGRDGVLANGRLVAINTDRRKTVAVFDPVPGKGNLGGMWGWGGVSVEPGGHALYAGIGNSHVYNANCSCYVDTSGYGEAMVKLSRPGLRVRAWNRPSRFAPTGDFDFGSAPLLFQPRGCPPLAAANGKVGWLFVWDRTRLGRGPRFEFPVSDGKVPFIGQPSYSPALRMIFDSHTAMAINGKRVGDGVVALSVDAQCRFHQRWLTKVGVGQEPPPLVVGNVVFAPGGDGGGFTALDARTGKHLWSLKTAWGTIAPPIAAEHRIFTGDLGGFVRAFAPR